MATEPNGPSNQQQEEPRAKSKKPSRFFILYRWCCCALKSDKPPLWIGAIATIVLALFARAAYLDARRQLIAGAGAFVFMEAAEFVPIGNDQAPIWEFIPHWRNSGDTAAANLFSQINYQVFPNMMPKGYYLTDFP